MSLTFKVEESFAFSSDLVFKNLRIFSSSPLALGLLFFIKSSKRVFSISSLVVDIALLISECNSFLRVSISPRMSTEGPCDLLVLLIAVAMTSPNS